MGPRIVIADDHQFIVDGIKRILSKSSDFEVIGEATDGRELVRLCSKLIPDVVVVDIELPVLDGIKATERLNQSLPEVKVIALSMHGDIKSLVAMIEAGASGYIAKESASTELVLAINAVLKGYYYLCPKMTTTMVESFLGLFDLNAFQPGSHLSSREREVLKILSTGAGTKEIAFSLGISPKTVDNHRLNIMRKVGADSLAELIKFAIREGITST